jgi:hypothetical protein
VAPYPRANPHFPAQAQRLPSKGATGGVAMTTTYADGILGTKSLEGPCPRCARPLRAIHTVSQYGRPSVALLGCERCRYTCQTVIPGLWPEEAFHPPEPRAR